MLSYILSFFRWRNLAILLGLVAIAALIWYLGPLLHLFGTAPLADADTRIWTIIGLFVLVVGIGLFRYWRARRANARMIGKLMDSDGLMSLTETQSEEEVGLLRERFEDALKLLKETRFGRAEGGGFMLDLPWYIIIGPPGSGKTTILRNSGLDFPLAERVGGDVLQGVGGTRNCDWWFTDEAVLLDTAGRYTTQDSNAAIDRAAWRGFLNLLKEFRRRRPINGVLLAISLDDILTRDPEDRAEHVEIFRKRLQELMRVFGMRLPVYLLITKCDLLSGFTEFFDALSDEEREQVWGMTFTLAQAETALATSFDNNFVELLRRVLARMPGRLEEERDPQRRRQIYAFPQQFGAVRSVVGSFIGDVFRHNRYEMAPILRGVYFTSGTQEGTPIDRLMSSFSRAFGLAESQVPRPTGKGKTFFIRDVLAEIIFPESGLVGTDRKLERRLAVTHGLGYAATIAVVALLSALWFSAFSDSRSEAHALGEAASQLAQARGTGPTSMADLVGELDQARKIAHFYDSRGFFAGWVTRIGLSSATALDPRAEALYRRALSADLLPVATQRLAAQLRASIGRISNEQLHDLLALYLMLDDSAHFQRSALGNWLRADSKAAFPLEPEKQAALAAHYEAMLELLPKPQKLDAQLVADARRALVRIPQPQAIYNALRADAEHNAALTPFSFAEPAGAAADVAFSDAHGGGLRTQVPGFYTRRGFYDGFVARLPGVVRNQMQTDWVLGQDANAAKIAGAETLIRQVSDLYVKDYVAAWQLALSHVALTRWSSLEGLEAVAEALIGPDRPLEEMLSALKQNTDLPRDGANAPQPKAPPAAKDASLVETVSNAITGTATTAQAQGEGLVFPEPWPGDQIKKPFQRLDALVDAPNGLQPPIQRITNEIGSVYGVVTKIAGNQDQGKAALHFVSAEQHDQAQDAATVLRNDAATMPEPLHSIMTEIGGAVSGTIVGGARQQAVTIWDTDVLPLCQAVVSNHYPFFREAQDETALSDFADFFKPGGIMDLYAKMFVPAEGPDKTPVLGGAKGKPPANPALPPVLADQIATASRIRAAFFSGNSGEPSVKFGLIPASLDPGLAEAAVEIDGNSVVYRHDPPRQIDFQWPSAGDAGTAKITVKDFFAPYTVAEEKGAWALFRLLDTVGIVPMSRPNLYNLSVKHNDMEASFTLHAGSSSNAFALWDLRHFRCYDGS